MLTNPFQASVPFLYPMKTSDNLCGFLMFSRGIEMEHWPKMSKIFFQKKFEVKGCYKILKTYL